MIKLYFLLIGICFVNVNAQIINIPDANFKSKLLKTSSTNELAKDLSGNYFRIDANSDGEIQEVEALQVSYLNLDNAISSSENNILSLIGISNFKKLQFLSCKYNRITSLDLSSLTSLENIDCVDNKLISLNVSGLINLKTLSCGGNQLATLDVNHLSSLEYIECSGNQLTFSDVSGLTNLKFLHCYGNQLTSLNVSGLTSLELLVCRYNQLTTLDTKDLINLQDLYCEGNKLKVLNLSGSTKLKLLFCSYNQISTLNLNDLKNLTTLDVEYNNLDSLFIKNGIDEGSNFSNNPNLRYICVDENQINEIQNQMAQYNYTNCVINSYCSFTPGGSFYAIQGNSRLDIDNNGCDANDTSFSNLNYSIINGIVMGNIISNTFGNYYIPVQEGTHTITPILENPAYYTVSPSSAIVTFPTQSSPFIQDFCVIPNGLHNDLEVTILPTIPARPGFDTTYKIIYKNKGTIVQSGSVSLNFNNTVLNYVSAIPAIDNQVTDKLTWDYINLQPLESREITVTLKVNSPMETPAVNIDDRLSFNALITPITGDEKPVDNSFALRQTVVGSFDPNDKTCLEGNLITPELIGEYVHYLIRFENTGTYPAENIVVKDLIDLSKFDISTLVTTKASHDFVTKISDNNKVEFIFEKINLPFDDVNNDGYIAFKIKTLPTLSVGDSFENEANIFFDYNFPILTNKAVSTFKTLGTQDFNFSDYFSVYPVPVNDILNIDTNKLIEVKSISIYNILGQQIIVVPDAQDVSKIDVSKLKLGNYFLKMNTDKGASTVKFIKK